MKKILSIILIIITLAALVVPIAATETVSGVDITKSSVTEDLQTIYNLSDYKVDSSDKGIYLITAMEYGYGTLDHTLYLYFFNPSKKALVGSDFNKITVASACKSDGTPTSYNKCSISICSTSTDKLFVKCKLNSGTKFYYSFDGARHYSIGEVELYGVADDVEGVKSYECGYTFSFSGSGDKLTCNRTDQLIISLDIHQTSYLTGDSAKENDVDFAVVGNSFYSNQINSVYFSIPKVIEQEYGDLYSIKYEYYKYRTSPILVVDDDNTYSNLSYLSGKKLGDGNFDYSIFFRVRSFASGISASSYFGYFFGDKLDGSSTVYKCYDKYPEFGTYQDYHTLVLKADDVTDRNNILISSNKLQDAFKNYAPLGEDNNYINHSGKVIGSEKYFGDLFDLDFYEENHYPAEVKVGEEFDMPSFADMLEEEGVGRFERLWKYGLDICLNIENYDNTIQDMKYIEQVKYTDFPSTPENASSKYLVSVNDITAFRDYCSDAARNSENVYLLRYAISDDYHCLEMEKSNLDGNIMLVQENVYLDFDIITLSFEKNGNITVIPVASDPSDGFTDIENVTPLPPNEAVGEYIDKNFGGLKSWWQDSAPKLLGLGILIIGIIFAAFIIIATSDSIFSKPFDTSKSLFSDKKDKQNNTTINIIVPKDKPNSTNQRGQGSSYRNNNRYRRRR